jgi:FixJ family two-component response regulator
VVAKISRGLRVALVDDDASLRRALSRAMRLAGFEVDAFDSAEALLAHGLPVSTACLVLDIDLPGMKGTELHRRLIDAGQRRPTIFITALGPEAASAALESLQPPTLLCKPFNKKDLFEAIARVCGEA